MKHSWHTCINSKIITGITVINVIHAHDLREKIIVIKTFVLSKHKRIIFSMSSFLLINFNCLI